MNICFLSEFCVSQFTEGTNKVTFDLAENLIQKGHKISIIFPHWTYLNVERDRTKWDKLGIKLIPIKKPFLNNPLFRTFWYFYTAFLYNLKEKQNIFFGFYTISPALACSLIKIIFPSKKCFAGIWELETIKKINSIQLIKKLLLKLNKIETLSKTAMKEFIGFPKEKLTFIYGHVNKKEFYPKPKNINLLKVMDFTKKDFIVLFVGRVSKLKGADILLESLKDTNKRIKCIFLGRILNDFPYLEKTKEWNLENRVFFTGYAPSEVLSDYYNLSDLVCLPSLNEGFGIVLAEGFACGKPAIVSNTIPLKEVVGNAGEVVSPFNKINLSITLNLFLNKKFYLKKQKNTLKTSLIYSKEKIMQEYNNFLLK